MTSSDYCSDCQLLYAECDCPDPVHNDKEMRPLDGFGSMNSGVYKHDVLSVVMPTNTANLTFFHEIGSEKYTCKYCGATCKFTDSHKYVFYDSASGTKFETCIKSILDAMAKLVTGDISNEGIK